MQLSITGILFGLLCGAIIGIANIIPGVSGGTMAVILNVYDKLIDSVTGLRKNFKKSILFLIPIGVGGAGGIFAFSKLLKFLLEYHPMPTFMFFIGLIVGSLPLVFNKAVKTKFRIWSVIPFAVFLGIMIVLAFIDTAGMETGSMLQLNVINWFYIFFGSVLAAMCMIIPGVSGSMIFLIIGLYPTVLGSISEVLSNPGNSIMILIPIALGVLVGVLGGAKLIDICIKKFPQMTFFAIMGLMVGSLVSLFKNSGFQFGTEGLIAIGALVCGFALSMFFSIKDIKDSRKEAGAVSGKKDKK